MMKCRYPAIVLMLFAVYTVIVVSPLAPLALKSPALAHAITGQCSGNCDICGCSAERRASKSCCCWMKKKRAEEPRVRNSLRCCSVEKTDCCSSGAEESKGVQRAEKLPAGAQESQPEFVYRCSPCGKGSVTLFAGTGSYQHLPYLFRENLSTPSESKLVNFHSEFFLSRYQEPPDPPPKLSFPSYHIPT
ncbi:MAG: hypothetical protein EG822_08240 [Deltaproteobacteria bacterium]|nr:hypothetical protein [Deltaproteobacteria bacterium]TLN02227.1 MAG: hypothetical protein FDZ73_12720 [bacterium]